MNPYLAYQNNQNPAWTRIDMLLALFDGPSSGWSPRPWRCA